MKKQKINVDEQKSTIIKTNKSKDDDDILYNHS